jgi:hypothetical protein
MKTPCTRKQLRIIVLLSKRWYRVSANVCTIANVVICVYVFVPIKAKAAPGRSPAQLLQKYRLPSWTANEEGRRRARRPAPAGLPLQLR